MTNAEEILRALDEGLNGPVELTLYGRAALVLGYADAPPEYARSEDVDAVLWLGQAEDLAQRTNFWEVTATLNDRFAARGLYLSHLFTEDQVILRPDWRMHRVMLPGIWQRLTPMRLGDVDLLLSKLMRDDPLDQQDARLIIAHAGLSVAQIKKALGQARVPAIPELQEQFALASRRILGQPG